MDHFQEAGRSLCETLLDYALPSPAQRGSFLRGKSNISRDTSFQIGVSPPISNDQLKSNLYSNAEIYVASPPAQATIKFASDTVETGIRGTDEFSDADDIASDDDSDAGFESAKKNINCVLNATQEDAGAMKFTNTRKRLSKTNITTAQASLDTEALLSQGTSQSASSNFMPLPSTNLSQKSSRLRRNRPPLLVSNARPPIKLPQPLGRPRQGVPKIKSRD